MDGFLLFKSLLNDKNQVNIHPNDSDSDSEIINIERLNKMSHEDNLTGAESGIMMSVDDIVQSTVRALLLQQEQLNLNAAQRQPPREPAAVLSISNKQISALFSDYDGQTDVTPWLQRIETIQDTYHVSDEVMQLITVSKLTGAAQSWFHSKNENITLSWVEIKKALTNMFATRLDKVQAMKKFEARRWRRSEKFTQYFQEKVVLGNLAELAEDVLIDYIIDAFDQPTLQSQARMYEFKTLEDLLRVMSKISQKDRFSTSGSGGARSSASSPPANRKPLQPIRCFNCNVAGHIATDCTKPKRTPGSCFTCGSVSHQKKDCPNSRPSTSGTTKASSKNNVPDSTTNVVQNGSLVRPYLAEITYRLVEKDNSTSTFCLNALIDSGSPISLIKNKFVPHSCISNDFVDTFNFTGVNGSKLNILGIFQTEILINNISMMVKFYVVPEETLSFNALLGRDFISNESIKIDFGKDLTITKAEPNIHLDFVTNEILQIDVSFSENISLNVDESTPIEIKNRMESDFNTFYLQPERPLKPVTELKMTIAVETNESPFFFRPRRLSYYEKQEVNKIVNDLLDRNIIRKSNSEYSSPIVLVKRKTGKLRMCIDYRTLNKITKRDNYPMPLIDDQIDQLRGKRYFSRLDLKDAFHHITIEENSIKYTSFVTPLGQYEYVKMPFGLRNSPAMFMRFVHNAFRELLDEGKIVIYIDDILVATYDLEENLAILREVYSVMVNNLLTVRLEKCSFLQRKISFLGYVIDEKGISPGLDNIESIVNYPMPQNFKQLRSFIGLASYFRRFIANFSIIAKPLHDLLKKNVEFKIGPEQYESFEKIKKSLANQPVLAIYNPHAHTQLHCDASSLGFASILLQQQEDGHLHPIMFFSKRTTETESRYHSFELEMLAIVYSLQRFRIYLQGISFKIITDCNSLTLAMKKKDINSKILRWSLILSNFNYQLEHRSSDRMRHVDALSRCFNVLVLSENTFERNLSIIQDKDPEINKIRDELEHQELPLYELRDGLVYRKVGKHLLFYVPKLMQRNVIHTCHDDVGHIGLDKTLEIIQRNYWFPNMRQKVKDYILNCLKCITYSPTSGKKEGLLHNIPKGNKPFDTIHVDHLGPLEKTRWKNKHILVVTDGFTKFTRLYPCKSTGSDEVVKHLTNYFTSYSKPNRIISDRGTAFSSNTFVKFLEQLGIQQILVATAAPRANGQAEIMNKIYVPMLAKLSPAPNKWDEVLNQVEFAMNNSFSRSTKTCPSILLFGVYQKGNDNDDLKDFLESHVEIHRENIEEIRNKASENINKLQIYNKSAYDKKHKIARKYEIGDYVVIINTDVTANVNKKLIPKYKGPYVIKKILPNDRYVVTDLEGFQVTQMPYNGVLDASRIKPWVQTPNSSESNNEEDSD